MTVEDLEVGMSTEKNYRIEYEDAVRFSKISGDWNPAHHDEEYAANSIFRERVAHGMFSRRSSPDCSGWRCRASAPYG